MTEEQKFFFDLKGWIVIPAVLSANEIESMKREIYDGARNSYAGRLQELLDHPSIVGVLTEILSESGFVSAESYSFRCEGSFTTIRPPGWSKLARGDMGLPHVVRPPQRANAMRYQVAGNKIFSGLTRVVWELEPVQSGQGGTSFLSGSHKAHFMSNFANFHWVFRKTAIPFYVTLRSLRSLSSHTSTLIMDLQTHKKTCAMRFTLGQMCTP